jgi:hypothetical protein
VGFVVGCRQVVGCCRRLHQFFLWCFLWELKELPCSPFGPTRASALWLAVSPLEPFSAGTSVYFL